MENGEHKEIDADWQMRRESRVVMNCLFRRKTRIKFGLLEQLIPSSSLARPPKTYHCKLLLLGKTGVGKTSTVSKLSGRIVPKTHVETLGIQTTLMHWPAKIANSNSEDIVVLELEFWDTGDKFSRKFDHIIPSMLASTNTIAFFFSFTDRNSWTDLPKVIEKAKLDGKIDTHLKVVVGTKTDSTEIKVTRKEITAFEKEHGIHVVTIGNVHTAPLVNGSPDGQSELSDIAPLLNGLTELVMNHQIANHKQTEETPASTYD